MPAGQRSGTGAMTELDDGKVRKDDILSNRDKAKRRPGQSLDGKGVQVDEYKDNPANRRPPREEGQTRPEPAGQMSDESAPGEGPPGEAGMPEPVDRPGFDLGGATGETVAGQGLGLGDDARIDRKDWRLPR
jgi:hypothetical protein